MQLGGSCGIRGIGVGRQLRGGYVEEGEGSGVAVGWVTVGGSCGVGVGGSCGVGVGGSCGVGEGRQQLWGG